MSKLSYLIPRKGSVWHASNLRPAEIPGVYYGTLVCVNDEKRNVQRTLVAKSREEAWNKLKKEAELMMQKESGVTRTRLSNRQHPFGGPIK